MVFKAAPPVGTTLWSLNSYRQYHFRQLRIEWSRFPNTAKGRQAQWRARLEMATISRKSHGDPLRQEATVVVSLPRRKPPVAHGNCFYHPEIFAARDDL